LHDQIEASVRDNKKKHVTRTHGLLGRLKEMGKLLRVYTQNIDGLEKTAGLEYVELPGVTPVGEKKGKETMVLDGEAEGEDEWEGDCVQLHGTLSSVRCSLCFWVGTWEPKHGRAFAKGETFDCPACENIGTLPSS
jgi:NAD-dependent SIR2 family protein deacetylase